MRQILVVAAGLVLGACSTTSMSAHQLERVAKDWCLNIRASQVIPVYPLTEDVQPGDVFLVRSTVEEQAKIYQERGFLPLDNVLVRFTPEHYVDFYTHGYGISAPTIFPPRHWQFPQVNYDSAPRAAFPTYTFAVSRSDNLSLAVPIKGVSVALGLMRSASANGSVSLKKCYTYGTDMASLEEQIVRWVKTHQEQINQLLPPQGDDSVKIYLRAVTRVYLAAEVDVTLFSTQKIDSSVSAQAPPNTIPASGDLKIQTVTERSVSFSEPFDRPLVIGYLAFDLPVSRGGLQCPVSTQELLQGTAPPTGVTVPLSWQEDTNSKRIKAWLDSDPENPPKLRAWMDQNGLGGVAIADIVTGSGQSDTRTRIVTDLQIP
jgi:hypothetical protein